ncbi:MAG: hypothetical protein EXR72_23885 [Myxococcales bacterium]|nr:hypothetical protein [Myxococcales bacterium]
MRGSLALLALLLVGGCDASFSDFLASLQRSDGGASDGGDDAGEAAGDLAVADLAPPDLADPVDGTPDEEAPDLAMPDLAMPDLVKVPPYAPMGCRTTCPSRR